MKKFVYTALIAVFSLILFGVVNAQNTNKLITVNSAGAGKLGMTVAQARKALPGIKLERTSDGEGVALINVNQGKNTLMTIYAGEENRDAPINEKAKIEQIEVWDKNFQTAQGVHPGVKIPEIEKQYGKLKGIMMSEIESREFAFFANHPNGIYFRLGNENGRIGIYKEGERRTIQYDPEANLLSIRVVGDEYLDFFSDDEKDTKFTSVYTDLNKNCKSEGGENGGHVSTFCKGVGGYQIHYFDSAANLNFFVKPISDDEDQINLAMQSLSYDTKNRKIEWRLADGNPFAVIMRTNKYETNDEGFPGKITGEYLIVKGLKGFENIDFEIDARKTPNANEKARELADNAYSGKSEWAKRINYKLYFKKSSFTNEKITAS